jgi:hypothetical protein
MRRRGAAVQRAARAGRQTHQRPPQRGDEAIGGRRRPAVAGVRGLADGPASHRSLTLHREIGALTESGTSSTFRPRSRRLRRGRKRPKNMSRDAPPAPRFRVQFCTDSLDKRAQTQLVLTRQPPATVAACIDRGCRKRVMPRRSQQTTWQDKVTVAAISALLAAGITIALRIVVQNLTF